MLSKTAKQIAQALVFTHARLPCPGIASLERRQTGLQISSRLPVGTQALQALANQPIDFTDTRPILLLQRPGQQLPQVIQATQINGVRH